MWEASARKVMLFQEMLDDALFSCGRYFATGWSGSTPLLSKTRAETTLEMEPMRYWESRFRWRVPLILALAR